MLLTFLADRVTSWEVPSLAAAGVECSFLMKLMRFQLHLLPALVKKLHLCSTFLVFQMRSFECFHPFSGDLFFPSFKLVLAFIIWQNTEVIASFVLNQACSVIVLALNHAELIQAGPEGHSDLILEEETLGRTKSALLLCGSTQDCVFCCIKKADTSATAQLQVSSWLTGRLVYTPPQHRFTAATASQTAAVQGLPLFLCLLNLKIAS